VLQVANNFKNMGKLFESNFELLWTT